MNFHFQLFCVVVLLLTLFKTGESLKCYQCRSAANGTCDNPLDTSKVTVQQCSGSQTFCGLLNVTINGVTEVVRECAPPNYCDQTRQRRQAFTNSFSRSCNICNSNFCNSSSSLTPFLGFAVIGLILGKYYC